MALVFISRGYRDCLNRVVAQSDPSLSKFEVLGIIEFCSVPSTQGCPFTM